MSRPSLQLRRGLQRLGTAGVLGLLLLTAAATVAALTLLPGWQHEGKLRQRLVEREATLAAERQARGPGEENDPGAQLARFYAAFPGLETLPDELEQLYSLAGDESLTLEQAQYKFSPEPSGRLARYEITVPASGRYPQLRRFIERALAELPALALRNLHFQRDRIDKENVDATLQFVLFVRIE